MGGSETYTVERERRIAAPPTAVRERIVDFRRWEAWSPWADLDPEMREHYRGAETGVGAVYEWEGNRKAGAGRMEIVGVDGSSDGSDVVTIDLRFLKPFKSNSTTTFRLRPDGDGTHVTWTMVGPRTFMVKVMGIFTSMEKLIGKDFEKGLGRLAADAE